MKISNQVADIEAKLEAYRVLFRLDKTVPMPDDIYSQPKFREALKMLLRHMFEWALLPDELDKETTQ